MQPIKELKKNTFLAQCICFTLIILGVIGIFLLMYAYRLDLLTLFLIIILSIIFIIGGLLAWIKVTKETRRYIWMIKNVEPRKMRSRLDIDEGMDSTDYFLHLKEISQKQEQPRKWHIKVNAIKFSSTQWQEANVFFEPKTEEPTLIFTQDSLFVKI